MHVFIWLAVGALVALAATSERQPGAKDFGGLGEANHASVKRFIARVKAGEPVSRAEVMVMLATSKKFGFIEQVYLTELLKHTPK